LRYFQLYPLHAAALISPEGTTYLFPANGYSGKTSITVSLARRGFSYLSDDTVLLRPKAEGVEILPFQRKFHIPLDLLEEIPELDPSHSESRSFGPHAKHSFSAEKIFPDSEAKPFINADLILFPSLNSTRESQLLPLTSREALSILLPQSLEVMFNPDLANSHLKALRDILEHGHCFRLLSGTDIRNDPDRLLEILYLAQDMKGGKV
jgi:hypothetical protein